MVVGNENMLENEDEEKKIDNLPFKDTRQHHHSIVDGWQCQSHRPVRNSASQLHGTRMPDLQCQDAWTDIGAFVQSISLPIRDLGAS